MKCLKIKKGTKNTYLIILEEKTLVVTDDILVKYNLLTKKDYSEKEINMIEQEMKELTSYYDAISYISRKMRSQKEVETFLKKKEYSLETIQKTIHKLEKEHLLDEDKYLEAYLHDTLKFSLDGPNKIKRKLEQLGIQEEKINIHLEAIDEEIWQEKIKKIITKKMNGNQKYSEKVWKQKVINYLYQNGYDVSKEKYILEDINLPNTLEIVRKEEQKIRKKLERKFTDTELEYQIKEKLKQKGFKIEEIREVLKGE